MLDVGAYDELMREISYNRLVKGVNDFLLDGVDAYEMFCGVLVGYMELANGDMAISFYGKDCTYDFVVREFDWLYGIEHGMYDVKNELTVWADGLVQGESDPTDIQIEGDRYV